MSEEFNIDDIIAEEKALEAAEAEKKAKAAAARAAAERSAAKKARVVMGIYDEEAKEKPVEKSQDEGPDEPEKPDEPKKKKSKKDKPEGKKKLPKWAVVLLCVIAALAIIAVFVVFVIYGGFRLWVCAELGDGAPDASAFLKDGGKASYVTKPDVSLEDEGSYVLTVKADGKERKVLLIVRDTKAPEAKSADPVITIDDEIGPMAAVKDVKDATKVTAKWKAQPNFGTAGVYKAAVELSDENGNSRTLNVKVTILGAADVVEYEAGTPHPKLEDFMVVEREDAKLVTDLDGDDIKWDVPGEYKVSVEFDGKTYDSTLKVVDTVAPKPDAVPAAVLKGGTLTTDDFVLGCDDATAVSYEFINEPATSTVGTVPCTIKATDLGGNKTEVQTTAVICDEIIEFEAQNDEATEADILAKLSGYAGYKMQSRAFSLTELGAHEVVLTSGENSVTVAAVVKDTTAPTAEGIECPCSTGYYCDAINFVTNIVDMSRVTARFETEPDWDTEGRQDVVIILRDCSGNETKVNAVAVIAPDKTAPVIYAAIDRTCYVGEAVAYFKEVFATDNADPEPKLTVDKSKVDAKTPGTYPVTYTATDENGNSSSVTVQYTFVERTISREQLDAAIDEVFAEIFTDGMTPTEQAYAIFNYCYDHIIYTGTSNKEDLYGEAYRGITQGVGDCYTFYAASYCMLEKIDCQLLSVERLNGKTQHFWCLVNLGTGWYHFDPCNVGPQHYRCFMKMNSDLEPLSPQYWRYDHSLYPDVETTPFVAPD